MKKILLVAYATVVAIFTPFMVDMAYKERGYFAIGGEYAFGFSVPFIIGMCTKEVK